MRKLTSQLFARKKSKFGYQDYGLIATKVVTTAFFELFVDALQSNIDLSTFRYHGSGTGSTPADITDITLEAEVESRIAGTREEEDSVTYKTVATITYTASGEITEHGIFSALVAGTLLDRSVFDAIEVVDGDYVEFTYFFSPSGITAEIDVCVGVDLPTLIKLEQLNQYLRVMAPALYALFEDQTPELFQRQLTDLNAKISDLEDADQAERNKNLSERIFRGM